MKRIFLASVALVVLVGTASAADLASKPYLKAPLPPVPYTNWSGFYLGGFGGYGWSDEVRGSIAGVGSLSGSYSDLTGGFGGGTIGYNWQWGNNFLLGIEVDAAGGSIGKGVSGSQTVLGATLAGSASEHLEAFGTVAGRVGWTFDTLLLYAKGGYAWGYNKISASGSITGLSTPLAGSYSESQVHSGWTVGGGLEWMFAPSWSAKVEYQYLDFEKENYLSSFAAPGVDLGASYHTIKAGVNYHFNWGGPLIAKY